MAEVVIRRCTLRVVRRRGWSWGPDPRRLMRAAVAALPALVERALEGLVTEEADLEVSAPVHLRVPVRLSELLALAGDASRPAQTAETPAARAVASRLARAAAAALPAETLRTETARDERAAARPTDARQEDEAARAEQDDARAPLLRLLLAWRERGELETHLAALDEPALAVWHDALAGTRLEGAAALPAEALKGFAREVASKLRARVRGRASLLRLRIVAVVECVERWQLSPDDPLLRAALDEAFAEARPRGAGEDEAKAAPAPVRDGEAAKPSARVRQEPPRAAPARPSLIVESEDAGVAAEVEVACALPFLLLGPLARVGYWEALAGALAAARLTEDAPLYAAALAYKVLSPPERGWRRAPQDERAAAAFAGLDAAPEGSLLTEFARRFSPHAAPLDSVVTHALIHGHDPDRPVLMRRDEGGGLVLFDTEGLFVVARADDWPSLLPAARHFMETPLLVPAESADPALLRALEGDGFTFVTDAAPARGESWRELRRTPSERWRTNARDAREAPLVRAGLRLARAEEEAAALWRALAVERPALPLARESRLEQSLTHAAALALGTLAWELWRTREETTPLLALERFADLEARVRFTETRVAVSLPLGRRHADLVGAGLLADVRGVPWLGRRVVRFNA